MAQETLLRRLDEAVHRTGLLIHEKDEAVAKMRSLEHEAKHLRSLVSLAESKVDEILEDVTATLGPDSVGAPRTSGRFEELERRFPRAFTSDF